MEQSFGRTLASLRKMKGLSQRALVNPDLNLSATYLTKLELDIRGGRKKDKLAPTLTRPQLWHMVTKLKLHHYECDELLGAAHHDLNRSVQEELDLRHHWDYPEVWEFTYAVGDYESPRFESVAANLSRSIRYVYFVSKESGFWALRRKLLDADHAEGTLLRLLECIVLPEELFQLNFTLFAPGQPGNLMFGCGAKSEHGISHAFYNLGNSETWRLHALLRGWREWVMAGDTFPRTFKGQQVFPKTEK